MKVSYKVAGRTRSQSYKTEKGAYRGIVSWLEKHQADAGFAILYAQDNTPQSFRCVDDVPFIAKKVATDFYATQKWKSLRYDILKRDQFRCVLCGATAADGITLDVDHEKPRAKFPELAYEPSNLRTLCDPCNKGKSDKIE